MFLYIDLKIKKLRELIETLPPATKEVLRLNKFGGLKYYEIAETLGISNKTVESHMRKTFQLIRKGFEGHGFYFLLFIKRIKWKKCIG
nr:sigma factor-like helix-turn-helix DNA-binding protein [uncultured Flavobacterium sp.]